MTAARAFAFDERGYQAGVYRDVMLRRWRNVSGRTMWDFVSEHPGRGGYLVLGLGREGPPDATEPPGPHLIAYGPLLSDDAKMTLGTAVLLEAPDAAGGIHALGPGRHAAVEVHRWRFGGRPR